MNPAWNVRSDTAAVADMLTTIQMWHFRDNTIENVIDYALELTEHHSQAGSIHALSSGDSE
jgi:hypothetical protein